MEVLLMGNIDLSDTYLTVAEASEQTTLTKSAIYSYARRGILSHLKIGRAIRIRKIDLEKFLDEHWIEAYSKTFTDGGYYEYAASE